MARRRRGGGGMETQRFWVEGAMNRPTLVRQVAPSWLVVLWVEGASQTLQTSVLSGRTSLDALPDTTAVVWQVRGGLPKWQVLSALLRHLSGVPAPGVECGMLIGPLPKQSRKQPAGVAHDPTMPAHRYIQHGYSEQDLCGRCGLGEGHAIHSFPLKRSRRG